MTQDAGLKVSEQGAWIQINLGTADAPKHLRLKLTPADFEELNRINAKIVEAGKPSKKDGKDQAFNADLFAAEVVGALAPHIVDWNLHDEAGKIDVSDENKRKQLARLMIAFATPDPVEGEVVDANAPKADRPTALTLIMAFIGDYSNFLGA